MHEFDLAPRRKYSQLRPIVLFGGLNGAGKTTILSAVRLALYGRQALGFAVSQKGYQEYLRELIHRNKDSIIPTTRAEISLSFSYAYAGHTTQYRVVREWEDKKRTVDERVRIYRDGSEVTGLSQDQSQAFLSHLVPQGVSQFFFFDGEKIANLAQDQSDEQLAASVRKLLGLDLIAKLKADLIILLRQKRGQDAGSARAEQEKLESDVRGLEEDVEKGLNYIRDELEAKIDEARERAGQIRAALSERGGAWSIDRNALTRHADELVAQRAAVEEEIRSHLNGLLPLAAAPKVKNALGSQLDRESAEVRRTVVSEVLDERISELRAKLANQVPSKYFSTIARVIDEVFKAEEISNRANVTLVHSELSDSDRGRIKACLAQELPAAIAAFQRKAEELEGIDARLAEISERLGEAPAEETLQSTFKELEIAGGEVGRLTQQKRVMIEELRRKTWLSIDLVRKLRRLEEKITGVETTGRVYARAERILAILDEFAGCVTKAKVEVLRGHFVEAFRRLARKEDMVADVTIDPHTFAVALIDRGGRAIPKERLSAGEKQIYAIAMLEALGKTSGRSLPVIIDTPLGRLDSKHRKKLVERYFPYASHQVLVLSTDTEVDEPFYQGMAKHVSHAYHLDYNQELGMTQKREGYFWKSREEGAAHAA